jgi:hypothetical protein
MKWLAPAAQNGVDADKRSYRQNGRINSAARAGLFSATPSVSDAIVRPLLQARYDDRRIGRKAARDE